MKKIVILEDEAIAAQHLQRTLSEVKPDYKVETVLQSIEESVEYLQQQPMPDLIFMDIHLADGLSFRIFDHVQVTCPIIFTTAYDQYALEAFKVNSIDYLLKPINRDDLKRALGKMEILSRQQQQAIESLSHTMRRYRSHFLIPMRDKLIPIEVKKIACLYLEDKISRAILYDGQEQIIDKPLDVIMESLDPKLFFRANRQYIVAHGAITEIHIWPISKLALTLSVPTRERVIIPKARVNEFKQWYTL
jgi:two-component system LytT family response regulator